MELISFPLLRLPYLPLKHVLSQIDLVGRFDLTFMTPALNNATKGLLMKADNFEIGLSNTQYQITITMLNQDKMHERLCFSLINVPKKANFGAVNGRSISMTRNKNSFKFKKSKNLDENLAIIKDLHAHLTSILHVDNYIARTTVPVFSTPIFDKPRKFSHLDISNQDLTVEQAKYVLETVETMELRFHTVQVDAPHGPQVFQLKHGIIHFEACEWLCFSSLLIMTCQELHIGKGNKNHLKVSDLINFVRTWSEGGFNSLKMITIVLPKMWLKQDLEYGYRTEVYESLVSMDLVVSKTHGYQKTIKRKDGKTALLSIDTSFKFTIDAV